MKTSIDLPEELLYRARVTAAKRRTTLKELVVQGLELALAPGAATRHRTQPKSPDAADAYFEIDALGVPVLKRRNFVVTEATIEALRDELGI